jgi:hypothetical protein
MTVSGDQTFLSSRRPWDHIYASSTALTVVRIESSSMVPSIVSAI